MHKKSYHPRWFVLYVLVGALLAAMFLQVDWPLSRAGHTLAGLGLLLSIFGTILAWLKANELAMLLEDLERSRGWTASWRDLPAGAAARSDVARPVMRPLKNRLASLGLLALGAYLAGLFNRSN